VALLGLPEAALQITCLLGGKAYAAATRCARCGKTLCVQMLFKKGKEKTFQAVRVDTEKDRLKALEYLSLSIDIQWPLSIVLSRHSVLVYQFYFKHLTLCKVWPRPSWGLLWLGLTMQSVQCTALLEQSLCCVYSDMWSAEDVPHPPTSSTDPSRTAISLPIPLFMCRVWSRHSRSGGFTCDVPNSLAGSTSGRTGC
jgi:hypothetical protein